MKSAKLESSVNATATAAATPAATASGQLPGLAEMLEEIRTAPEIVRPSRFWEYHAELQLRDLEADGFDEFKRTMNRFYFQFRIVNPADPQYRAMLGSWLRHPTIAPLRALFDTPPEVPSGSILRLPAWLRTPILGRSYAIYLTLLCEYARRRDRFGLLERLDEPGLGHPITIDWHGRRVSEDLCNSVLEYTSMIEAMPGGLPQRAHVIELGSGYGRVAWLFAQARPDVRYMLVDIPPALAMAQRYLTQLMPDRRVFAFRHFDRYEDVAEELSEAQIAFLTPNQLDLLPAQHADVFINISSVHEMRRDQIEHYFRLINHHTAGFFYTKQWIRSRNPYDDIVVARGEYPLPSSWRVIFDRIHPVQRRFFEAFYDVRASASEPAGGRPEPIVPA